MAVQVANSEKDIDRVESDLKERIEKLDKRFWGLVVVALVQLIGIVVKLSMG